MSDMNGGDGLNAALQTTEARRQRMEQMKLAHLKRRKEKFLGTDMGTDYDVQGNHGEVFTLGYGTPSVDASSAVPHQSPLSYSSASTANNGSNNSTAFSYPPTHLAIPNPSLASSSSSSMTGVTPTSSSSTYSMRIQGNVSQQKSDGFLHTSSDLQTNNPNNPNNNNNNNALLDETQLRLKQLGVASVYDPTEASPPPPSSSTTAASTSPAYAAVGDESYGTSPYPTASSTTAASSSSSLDGGSDAGGLGAGSKTPRGGAMDATNNATKLFLDISDPVSFAHRPAPKKVVIQCYIIRDKGSIVNMFATTFKCHFQSDHTFLIGAKKIASKGSAYYSISVDPKKLERTNNNACYLGKLRSNFMGTEFCLYDTGVNPGIAVPESKTSGEHSPTAVSAGNNGNLAKLGLHQASQGHDSPTEATSSSSSSSSDGGSSARSSPPPSLSPSATSAATAVDRTARRELAVVTYESNVLTSKGPRKMTVLIPRIRRDNTPVIWRPLRAVDTLLANYRATCVDSMHVLMNKVPKWNETIGAYVLNFNGRVTVPSVKNFQICLEEDPETVVLQFGRTGKNHFTMDFTWPLTLYQAFGICMSSLDSKLACD